MSDEKIKVLFSSNFNLSKNSEEQKNQFYDALEKKFKDELLALDENSTQGEEFAGESQFGQLSPNFFIAWSSGDNKGLFQLPDKPTILGAVWRDDKRTKVEELDINQKRAEKVRRMLLLEFLLALLATIFFAHGLFKNRSRRSTPQEG